MANLRTLQLVFQVPLEILYILFYSAILNFWSLFRVVFSPKPKSIRDEVVLVSGGANGIGRSICHQLIEKEKNITIIIWDVNQQASLETALELKAAGVKSVFTLLVDVSDQKEVEEAARKIRAEIGDVTMLFNNAGINGKPRVSWREDPKDTAKIFAVNALSHCWTLREFLPAMIEAGKGHVIESCSVLGFTPAPTGAAYCASKFAIQGYIESVKEEVRLLPSKPKIAFTTVYPHHVATDLTANINFNLKRYSFLNFSMTPDFVASKIVEGVLQGKEHIYIPGIIRAGRFLIILQISRVNSRNLEEYFPMLFGKEEATLPSSDNTLPETVRKCLDMMGIPVTLNESGDVL